MDSQPSVLIISRSAQLRNSLKVLIQASPLVKSIGMIEDIQMKDNIDPGEPPSLVLLAFGPEEKGVQNTLNQVKTRWLHTPTLVLVDNERQLLGGISAEAEIVLVEGVLAANLLKTVESLLG